MGENNVIISIKGVHSMPSMDDDVIELVTDGTLAQEGGDSYTLSYQESEVTGMEGTLTTFHIEPERITLMRMGEFSSQMVFEEGRRHLSLYNTPYGPLSVEVNTHSMLSHISPSGGEIKISYYMEIGQDVRSTNTFEISVRESPSAGHPAPAI